MPQAGSEPTIPGSERKQAKSLDRTATRIGHKDEQVRSVLVTAV